jgi:hypothetical protein
MDPETDPNNNVLDLTHLADPTLSFNLSVSALLVAWFSGQEII